MRFHSTPESALNGEITKLAILECIVSVTIYFAIGFHFGTFRYFAMAVVAAPLMLFRTQMSSEWGLRLFNKFGRAIPEKPLILAYPLLFFVTPVVAFAIRIVATLYWAVQKPVQTLREMPQNWVRQALCTDFFHPPEILQLEATKGEIYEVPTFTSIWDLILKDTGEQRVLKLIVYSPYLLIGYVPSLIYRVSFKATAPAYLPFVWVVHATLRNPMPADKRLTRITKGELEKVRRAISWLIFATLAAKMGFVLGWVDWDRIEEKFPSKKLVQSLVVPNGWPWWQITLGVDALLTFFLLFFADAALARLNSQQAWREETVLGTVSTLSFLRAAISLVTISHFFRIALIAVAPGPLHRLLAG